MIIPFSARLSCERLRCFPGYQWTWFKGKGNEWRFYLFAEGGTLTLYDTLPEQASHFDLASYGFGSRIRLEDHLNGSNDVGVPLISTSATHVHVTGDNLIPPKEELPYANSV